MIFFVCLDIILCFFLFNFGNLWLILFIVFVWIVIVFLCKVLIIGIIFNILIYLLCVCIFVGICFEIVVVVNCCLCKFVLIKFFKLLIL